MLTQCKELGRLYKHEPSLTIHYNLANAPPSPIIMALLTLSFLSFLFLLSTLLSAQLNHQDFFYLLSRGLFLLKPLKAKIFISQMKPLKGFASCSEFAEMFVFRAFSGTVFSLLPCFSNGSTVQGNSAQLQHLTLYVCPPQHYLIENPSPPHKKFLNPSGKPPNKTILLIQTPLSAEKNSEISVLKGYLGFFGWWRAQCQPAGSASPPTPIQALPGEAQRSHLDAWWHGEPTVQPLTDKLTRTPAEKTQPYLGLPVQVLP